MRRSDLRREALLGLFVALDRQEAFTQTLFGEVLERTGDLLGAVLLLRGEQQLDLIRIGLGFLRHQVAADPGPDRVEAGARDTAAMLALRCIVDDERLDRGEEQPLRIADARKPLPFPPGRLAQRLENERGAGRALAAQVRALKLRGEQ